MVLHGDIHHANVLRHAERGWLAIDPKGLLGEPTYDLANALRNPIGLPDLVRDPRRVLRQAAVLAEVLGVDRARLLAFAFAHACLSAAWDIEDGTDPAYSLSVAEVLMPFSDGS